jgi:hypothetical protein
MKFNAVPGAALEKLLRIIEETFPVPGRFRSTLPGDVAELSRLLTSARPEREGGYLSRPNLLSAYLRYFLPWNVFRLFRLFSLVSGDDETGSEGETGRRPEKAAGPSKSPAALFLGLNSGDAVTDLGSGPLTLPVALWLFCPELRKLDLEFRCVDHSASVLEAGKKLFAAMEAAEGEASWKIRTIHDSVNAPVRGEKAALVTAINIFNEMYQRDDPAFAAEKAARILDRSGGGSVLVMEPGIPKSGAFIAALRDALLVRKKKIAAPCTHEGPCPLPGIGGQSRRGTGAGFLRPGGRDAGSRGKAKWCHFAFDTAEAPAELHRLSAAAGIPKERAVFSFLLAEKTGSGGDPPRPEASPQAGEQVLGDVDTLANQTKIRVLSDAFPVPGGWGRYGCGHCEASGYETSGGSKASGYAAGDETGIRREKGLMLLRGSKAEIERTTAGTIVEAVQNAQAEFDGKTGALIVSLTDRR